MESVLACYEAGACGFELYRRVTELNVACMVVAPASILRTANDWIKTDRRDARNLALGLRSGELCTVHVPTRRNEATPARTPDEYLVQVGQLEKKRNRMAECLEAMAMEPEYENAVKTLRAFKGTGTLIALSFVVEIGDYRRLLHAGRPPRV